MKLTLQGVLFGKEGCLGSELVYDNKGADYCVLIHEWAWLRSRVCFLWLEVDLGSVLELEFGQKWRYGALKACIAESGLKCRVQRLNLIKGN